MKQFFSYLGASLAAIAALASCNKEIDAPVEDLKGGVPFEICASTADTKTAINDLATSWVADDAINLFHAEAGTATYISDDKFTISAENLSANKFKGTLGSSLEDGTSYDWYAIYPYNSKIATPANTGTNGWVTVGGTTQTQEGNDSMAHLCGDACPLYGVATGVASNVVPSIKMKHLTSIIEVNVTNNSGEDLIVTNVTFTGSENIVGTYFINFVETPVAYKASNEKYVSNTASLSVSKGEAIANGSSAKFYIAVKPFTATAEQTLSLSVNGYSKDIPHSGDVDFTAGKIKKINFKYDKEPEVYTLVQTDGAFEDGGKYVFAFKNGNDDTYFFISNGGSSNNLSKSALTVSGGKITDPSISYVFTATADDSGFKLANSAGKYIYNSGGKSTTLNTNNDAASTWYPTFISASKTYKLSQGSTTGRYISYGTSETKAMGYANSSFKDQINTKVALTQYCGAISVFKLGYTVTLEPAILADNVTNVSARGLSAVELTCNIENPVDGLTLSAACDGTVVTEVEVIDGVVRYSVAQNLGEARDGRITLTYGSVSKTITVSQLAPVFKVSSTEVELEATAGSSSTITVTSDFDWISDATGAGFTSTPTTCEWNSENPYTDGKTKVTITASAKNDSEEGAKTLGTLTFTNMETSEKLVVTVTQKTSYVAPGKSVTFTFASLGYSNADDVTTVSADDNGNTDITLTFGLGTNTKGNAPKYYSSGTGVRMYVNNILEVNGGSNTIKSIAFTFSGNYTGTLNSDPAGYSSSTWKGSSKSVTFSNTGSTNRIQKIVVTYE